MVMTEEQIRNLPPPPGWIGPVNSQIQYCPDSLAAQEQPNPAAARAIDQATKRITKSLVNPTQEASEVIVGVNNEDIQQGSSITQKSRIFDGDSARFANLLDYLESIGCNKRDLDGIRTTVFGVSLGYCKEIPDYGMRGEILEFVRPRQQKQKDQVPQQLPANGQQPINQPNETQEGQA